MANQNMWELFNVVEAIFNTASSIDKEAVLMPYNYLFLKQIIEVGNIDKRSLCFNRAFDGIDDTYQTEQIVDKILNQLETKKLIEWNHSSNILAASAEGKKWYEQISKKIADTDSHNEKIISSLTTYIKQADADNATFIELENEKILDLLEKFILSYGLGKVLTPIKNPKEGLNLKDSALIIATFLLWASENDKEVFKIICDKAVAYHILQIWNIPDTPLTDLSSTRFYLDTHILTRLSGAEGEEQKDIVTNVLSFIRNHRGTLYIFEATNLELDIIYQGARNWYNKKNYDDYLASPLARYFRNHRDVKFSTLQRLDLWYKEFIDNTLSIKQSIKIDRDDYFIEKYQKYEINVKELEDNIRSYRENRDDPDVISSINRDTKNISAIYKIRKDDGSKLYNTFKNTPAILITNNENLYKACSKIQRGFNSPIPPVIPMRKMLYWIHKSNKAEFYSVMEKDLHSYAYIQVQSSPGLIERLKKSLEQEGENNIPSDILIEQIAEMKRESLIVRSSMIDNPDLIISEQRLNSIAQQVLSLLKSQEKLIEVEREGQEDKAVIAKYGEEREGLLSCKLMIENIKKSKCEKEQGVQTKNKEIKDIKEQIKDNRGDYVNPLPYLIVLIIIVIGIYFTYTKRYEQLFGTIIIPALLVFFIPDNIIYKACKSYQDNKKLSLEIKDIEEELETKKAEILEDENKIKNLTEKLMEKIK